MDFAQPTWLWLLLALPLVAVAEVSMTRRDRARVAGLVARPLWPKVVQTLSEPWRLLRLALVLVGGAGLVLALSRPQWGIVREKVEREGVDVVLLLDTSGSMATEDVAPSRFALAKAALASLVRRLEGDRIALVAFEGDAYPLVPLTLDAEAVDLFLETLEPGAVPSPGTSVAAGIVKGLNAFADEGRRNKAMILVSDGEDLEGAVDAAVSRAKEAGVVVHTVGVGTTQGQPVPDFDREGRRTGFKKNEDGSAVVSRFHPEILEAIARGTGGRSFTLTPADLSLSQLASTLEGMEQRALAREYSYRKRERFQAPLGVGVCALALALLLPPPGSGRRRAVPRAALTTALLVALAPPAGAESRLADELLLRPTRLTAEGRRRYQEGDDPKAVDAFQRAAAARPGDVRARFNLADALYKSGKLDDARAVYEELGADPRSPLAPAARYNLGNTLFQKQDYPGAVRAYRDALRLAPGDAGTRHNLELALRAGQQQQRPDRQKPGAPDARDSRKDRAEDQRRPDPRASPSPEQGRPRTEEEKERQRFEKETGMPKERAMQLLDALQQNEKLQQSRLQASRRKAAKRGRDW